MIISTTNKGYNSASITAVFNIETAQTFYEVSTYNGKEYKKIKYKDFARACKKYEEFSNALTDGGQYGKIRYI